MLRRVAAVAIGLATGLSLAACGSSVPRAIPTSSPTVARACSAVTRVVDVAAQALSSVNPDAYQHFTSAQWKADILGTELSGGPYLQAWPVLGAAHYLVSVAPATPFTTSGDHVTTMNGDVIVTSVATGLTYDATVHPVAACANL